MRFGLRQGDEHCRKSFPRRGEHAQEDRAMNMEVSRRQLIVGAGAGVAGTTLGALGFGDIETVYATSIRAWKILGTTETLCSQTASFARRPVRPRCATRWACPHRYW